MPRFNPARRHATSLLAAALPLLTACGAGGDANDGGADSSASADGTASASDTDSASGVTASADGETASADATAEGGSVTDSDSDSVTDSDSDSDSNTDSETDTDTGGDPPGACPGSDLVLRLMSGQPAPGLGDANAVFESFGRAPQQRDGVLAFTAYVTGGAITPGTEVLYRWDLLADDEPAPIVVTGEVIAGTSITPVAFNGLPVVAPDGTIAYQVVAGGDVYVMRHGAGTHAQMLSEGTQDSPNGLPITAIAPFSNFARGAAYVDGTLAMWVEVEDAAGFPAWAIVSRVDDGSPGFHMGSDDVFGLPAGHSWEPQEARVHLGAPGLGGGSLLVWARVMGVTTDRGLITFGGGGPSQPILGPLSSGWRQVGFRPSGDDFAYYHFDGDDGTLIEGASSFPVKGEAVPGRADLAFGDLEAFALDDAGGVVFAADTLEVDAMGEPVGTPAIVGLFRRDAAGNTSTIALEGDAAPDLGATISSFHSVQVSRSGDVAYRAFLDGLNEPNATGLFTDVAGDTRKVVASQDEVELGSDCRNFQVRSVSNLSHGTPTPIVEVVPHAGGRQVAFDGESLPAHLELYDLDDPGAPLIEALVSAYVP